jgi:hypothetical protein
MRSRLISSVLMGSAALLLAAGARSGQQATTAPAASSDCSAAEYRRLDFKIGDFEVTGMGGARAGDSRVVSALGGCALVEYWHGAISGYGQALYYYSRADQRWHLTFVNDDGESLLLDGSFASDTLTLGGAGAIAGFNGLHRMAWSPLPDGGVKQFWEISTDNGASWKQIHVGTYARRR